MTIEEAGRRYEIPMEIIREYEDLKLCSQRKSDRREGQYDEEDIKRLSMIMALHDAGFTEEDVESYMRLLQEGEHTREERLEMINRHRSETLHEIHFKQNQLDRLDYLRYIIQKKCI